jgi:peptidoglycan/LPS O-acetylase OafA/YrhL
VGGRGRVAALDGVRGVAILLVLLGHGMPPLLWVSDVGVGLFFALSGYLITGILLRELRATGRLRLGAFYLRRVARLAPPLLVMVLAVGVLLDAMGKFAHYPSTVGWVLSYGFNWAMIGGARMNSLGHAWSLSVEEQFYAVWPLVVLASWRSRRLGRWCLALGVASLAWRLVVARSGHGDWATYGTDTNAAGLLLGAWLAVRGWQFPSIRALERRWLTGTGRISYGLYLWHFPLVILVTVQFGGWWAAVTYPVALAAALASWRWVEQPSMRAMRHAVTARGRPAEAEQAVYTV